MHAYVSKPIVPFRRWRSGRPRRLSVPGKKCFACTHTTCCYEAIEVVECTEILVPGTALDVADFFRFR